MAQTLTELKNLVKNKRKFPKSLKIYFVSQDGHFLISNGEIQKGFPNDIIPKTGKTDRNSLISAYDKMGFFFDEMIRISLTGFNDDKKCQELYYILNLVPMNRKIRLFLDWKVFDPEFTRFLSRLFEVKNEIIHNVNLNEVKYRKKKTLNLSEKKDLQIYKKDLETAWKKILKIYMIKLEGKNLNQVVEEIKNYQES